MPTSASSNTSDSLFVEEQEQLEAQAEDQGSDLEILRTPNARPFVRISPPTSSFRALYPRDHASQLNSSPISRISEEPTSSSVHPTQSRQLSPVPEIEESEAPRIEASAPSVGRVIPDSQSVLDTPETARDEHSSVDIRDFGVPNTASDVPSTAIDTQQVFETSPVAGTIHQDTFASQDPDQAFLEDDPSQSGIPETVVANNSVSPEPESRLRTQIPVAIGDQPNIEESQNSQTRASQATTLSEVDPNISSNSADRSGDRSTGKASSQANCGPSNENFGTPVSQSVTHSQLSQSQNVTADQFRDSGPVDTTLSQNIRPPDQSTTLSLIEAPAQISFLDGTMPTPPPRLDTPSSDASNSTSMSKFATQPRERKKDPGRFKDNIAGLFKRKSATPSSTNSSVPSAQPPPQRSSLSPQRSSKLSSDRPRPSQSESERPVSDLEIAAVSRPELAADQTDPIGQTKIVAVDEFSNHSPEIAQQSSYTQTAAPQIAHNNVASSNELRHPLPTSGATTSSLPISNAVVPATFSDPVLTASHDFSALLCMDKDTKVLYQKTLRYFQKTRRDDNGILRQLLGICCHPDASNELPATQAMGVETQADWTVLRSSKFAFLESLLAHVLLSGNHIVIYANSANRLMDLTEDLVRRSLITYFRCDTGKARLGKDVGASRVTLIPTGCQHAEGMDGPADVVIGLDSTFDVGAPQIQEVRRRGDGSICPSITLIIANSIEHILQKYRNEQADSIPPTETLLDMATRHSSVVGDKSAETCTADSLGKEVAQAMTCKAGSSWAHLPSLLDLPDLVASDLNMVTGVKRKAPAQNLGIPPSKRQRTVLPTHTESWKDPAEAPVASYVSTGEIADFMIHDRTTGTTAPPRDNALAFKTLQLELEYVGTDRNKLALLTKEQEIGMSSAQGRYEAQDQALAVAIKQIKQREEQIAGHHTQIQSRDVTIEGLRTERNTLREQLRDERQKTVEGLYGPAAQEAEELRIKAARTESLERKLASLEKDTDYLKSAYQSARDEASSQVSENKALREELETYKRKASIEVRKLAQMRDAQKNTLASSAVERAQAESRQYKMEVERLAKANKDLTDELEREKERRGMGGATRSASLPPGRALPVPGPAALAAAGFLGGAKGRRHGIASASASRAVSPMPGMAPSAKTSPLQRTIAMAD